MTLTLSTIETAAIKVSLSKFEPEFLEDLVTTQLEGNQDQPGSCYVRVDDVNIKSSIQGDKETQYRLKILHPEVPGGETQNFRYKRRNITDVSTLTNPDFQSNDFNTDIHTFPGSCPSKGIVTQNISTYSTTEPNVSYLYLDDPNFKDTEFTANVKDKFFVNGQSLTVFVSPDGTENSFPMQTLFTAVSDPLVPSGTIVFRTDSSSGFAGQFVNYNSQVYTIQLDNSTPGNFIAFNGTIPIKSRVLIQKQPFIKNPVLYITQDGPPQKGIKASIGDKILFRNSYLTSLDTTDNITAFVANVNPSFYNMVLFVPSQYDNGFYSEAFSEALVVGGTVATVSNGNQTLNVLLVSNPNENGKQSIGNINKANNGFYLFSGSTFKDGGISFTDGNPFSFNLSPLTSEWSLPNIPSINPTTKVYTGPLYDFDNIYTGSYSLLPTDEKSSDGNFIVNSGGPQFFFRVHSWSNGLTSGDYLLDKINSNRTDYHAILVVPGLQNSVTLPGDASSNLIYKTAKTIPRIFNALITDPRFADYQVPTGQQWFSKKYQKGFVNYYENPVYSYPTTTYGIFFDNANNMVPLETLFADIYNDYDIFNFATATSEFFYGEQFSPPEPVLIGQYRKKFDAAKLSYRFILEHNTNNSGWKKVTDSDSVDTSSQYKTLNVFDGESNFYSLRTFVTDNPYFTTAAAYTTNGSVIVNKTIIFFEGAFSIKSVNEISNIDIDPTTAGIQTNQQMTDLKNRVISLLTEIDNEANGGAGSVVIVLPEQNLVNKINHVYEKNINPLDLVSEKTYNMIIAFSNIDDKKLFYRNTFSYVPSIDFSGVSYNTSNSNISSMNFANEPFASILLNFETETGILASTVDMILIIPRTKKEDSYLPSLNSTKTLTIFQTGTASGFELVHNSVSSWIDISFIPGLKTTDQKYLKSVADTHSSNFGTDDFVLRVGTDVILIDNANLPPVLTSIVVPKINELSIGVIIDSSAPSNSVTLYHSLTGKSMSVGLLSSLSSNSFFQSLVSDQIYRSEKVPSTSPIASSFSNFNGSPVDLILVVKAVGIPVLLNETYSVPRYYRTKTIFTDGVGPLNGQGFPNGSIFGASTINFYSRNPNMVESNLTTNYGISVTSQTYLQSIDRDFEGESYDLYYYAASSDKTILGVNFVDDLAEVNISSGDIDINRHLRRKINDVRVNRDLELKIRAFVGTPFALRTDLKWTTITMSSITLNINGNSVVIDLSNYRGDVFKFGHRGKNLNIITVKSIALTAPTQNEFFENILTIEMKTSEQGVKIEDIKVFQGDQRSSLETMEYLI